MKMKRYMIYEIIHPIIGKEFEEYVGTVSAATEISALNKAKRLFRIDRGGVPYRYRRPENFTAYTSNWF